MHRGKAPRPLRRCFGARALQKTRAHRFPLTRRSAHRRGAAAAIDPVCYACLEASWRGPLSAHARQLYACVARSAVASQARSFHAPFLCLSSVRGCFSNNNTLFTLHLHWPPCVLTRWSRARIGEPREHSEMSEGSHCACLQTPVDESARCICGGDWEGVLWLLGRRLLSCIVCTSPLSASRTHPAASTLVHPSHARVQRSADYTEHQRAH
jgi:hypothetical protein